MNAATAFGADTTLPALEQQMAPGFDASCLQPVHLQLALLHGKHGERVLCHCCQAYVGQFPATAQELPQLYAS